MTAIVGILNKHAVAIAGDSAVTVGASKKIFNKANKVFALSKHHPVGIMIYNSAALMHTPWETIIKVYRNHLGNLSFRTLSEYQQDFLEFLRSKNYYCDSETDQNNLWHQIHALIDQCVATVEKDTIDRRDNANFNLQLEAGVDALMANSPWGLAIAAEFVGYTQEQFDAYSQATFESVTETILTPKGFNISTDISNKIKRLIFTFLTHQTNASVQTGLVFCGFGEDEIYPRMISVFVDGVFDGRLKYRIDNTVSIGNKWPSSVQPFGQTDVINTILAGIDSGMQNSYTENMNRVFVDYQNLILTELGEGHDELKARIAAIDVKAIVDTINVGIQEAQDEIYIRPLFNALRTLSKEDLAEMAESLIYITYLKRRMTDGEESVGGPVDVAVISKGDGFVWIKRKHYFSRELNDHFFSNYI